MWRKFSLIGNITETARHYGWDFAANQLFKNRRCFLEKQKQEVNPSS